MRLGSTGIGNRNRLRRSGDVRALMCCPYSMAFVVFEPPEARSHHAKEISPAAVLRRFSIVRLKRLPDRLTDLWWPRTLGCLTQPAFCGRPQNAAPAHLAACRRTPGRRPIG